MILHDGLSFFGRLFSLSSSGWCRRQASLSSSPRRSLSALRSSSASRSRRSRSRRFRFVMPLVLLLFHATLSRARLSIRASSCAVTESINWSPFYPPNHGSLRCDALPLRAGRLSALLFRAMATQTPSSRSRSCSSASLRTRSLSGFVCSSMLFRTSARSSAARQSRAMLSHERPCGPESGTASHAFTRCYVLPLAWVSFVLCQVSRRDSSRSRSCSMRCMTSSPITPSLRSSIRVLRCARSNSLKRRW
jgi:hypothetical protein